MARRRSETYRVGQTGEHLVAAELGRRGVASSILSGNAPDIDILAFRNGKALPIQVKAIRSGSMHARADRYLDIEMNGDRQVVLGKKEDIDRSIVFVIVFLGENAGEDRFYILTSGDLQDQIAENHLNFLAKHQSVRPRNPKSMHTGVSEDQLLNFAGRWDTILAHLE